MHLLKANYTGSVGKTTGAIWKGKPVIKAKIDSKVKHNATQITAVRSFEAWLRMLRDVMVFLRDKYEKNYPNMTRLNWLTSHSPGTYSKDGLFWGSVDIDGTTKDLPVLHDAAYDGNGIVCRFTATGKPGTIPSVPCQQWQWDSTGKFIRSDLTTYGFSNGRYNFGYAPPSSGFYYGLMLWSEDMAFTRPMGATIICKPKVVNYPTA
jgi:hypothetical protein